ITRLHLEEDAGKLVHEASDGRLVGADQSFVDYNRGGVPLAEIVSEPDIRSAAEAKEYVARLRQLVRYLGVSDGDMEKGSLRVDANISVKCSDGRWGDRAEVKNLNSLRALERALEYEFKRQSQLLAEGKTVTQETRHWNDVEGVTMATRSKEEAHDYRYFPEPDLPPLLLPDGYVDKIKETMPELPWQKVDRFEKSYKLNETDAMILTEHIPLADFYEACVKAGASPQRASNWVRTEVLRIMNEQKIEIEDFPIKPAVLAQLVSKVDDNKISTTAAREVFDMMAARRISLEEAMSECGVEEGGISGSNLENMVRGILKNNADVVEIIKTGQDKKGKKQKFLQGLIMKEARGQADPKEAASVLAQLLEE
ncbi:MAG: Asp-tRNA(Asn)/Glu-tRNA(Gln) amidotransferase subunit GatB, partial [Aminobacterium sp.]|nr:Asp-tRNA(Asn)/Glu-tRNA(Gln) amidotransferase subunit GatB [Aminobacterium sp.]